MKKLIIYFSIAIILVVACQNTNTIKLRAPHPIEGTVLGDSVLDNNIKDAVTLISIIAPGDFVKANLAGKVEAISKDGVWLKLMDNKIKTIIVGAKDNAFVFSRTMVGKEIIVYGEARFRNLSVAAQKENVFNKNIDGLNPDSSRDKEIVFVEALGVVIPKK